MVIVNVLNIPVEADEAKNADIEFWKEFDRLARASADEELLLSDFPRANLGREIITFDGEEQAL